MAGDGNFILKDSNALGRLKKSRKALRKARQRAMPLVEPGEAQRVDHSVDSGYRARDGFLASWEELGEELPEAAEAERVRSALFPDGLRLPQLPYRFEWGLADVVKGAQNGPISRA